MTAPKAAGTSRSAQKRQAVLEAAAELFLRHGFDATSMDDVAAAADVSKQTVYAQFKSKEALFLAMVEDLTHAAGDHVQQGMPAPPPGTTMETHLERYALRQLEGVQNPQLMRLRRLAIGEVERFPQLGRAVYAGGPGRAIAGLAAAFARWTALGLLDTPDATVAATHFNWLVMGEPVNRIMMLGSDAEPPTAGLRRHAREAVRVFLAAYGPPPKGSPPRRASAKRKP
jgi:TetR/AcrR family transcriptional repressor of mexJK operon